MSACSAQGASQLRHGCSPTKSTKAVVGLDIEAGSVAAAEVSANGHAAVGKFGIVPLGAGRLPRGRGHRPGGPRGGAQGAVLQGQALEDGPGRARQPAGRGADPAAAADRRPRPSSRRRSASRPRTTSRCRSSRRCSTGRWSGTATGENGERYVDVVAVAARRDMLGGLMQALDAGGPAPGRDRPLRVRDDPRARRRGPSRRSSRATTSTPPALATSPVRPAGGAVPQPAEASAPRSGAEARARRGSTATSATSPTSRSPAARPACSPGSRRSGSRGSPRSLAERRELTLEHARQWLVHVGLDRPARGDRGRRRDGARRPRRARRGRRRELVDELRLSLEYYAAQEGAVPVDGDRRLRPGDDDPRGSSTASSATSDSGSRSADPRRWPSSTTRRRLA